MYNTTLCLIFFLFLHKDMLWLFIVFIGDVEGYTVFMLSVYMSVHLSITFLFLLLILLNNLSEDSHYLTGYIMSSAC